MNDNVWLILQYDWEHTRIISVCTSKSKAYKLRREYLQRWKEMGQIEKPHSKSVQVVKYTFNKIIGE